MSSAEWPRAVPEPGLEAVAEIGPSAYGTWMEESRVKRGLTIEQLAVKAGLSVPAIYNIRSGRTQNPNSSTRARLESALGEAPSQQVIAQTERETAVEGLGSLQSFNPYELDEIPAEPGIYVFYDISDRPVYVGRSRNMRRRVKQHGDRFWFRRPIVEDGSYIQINDNMLLRQVEEILIRFLKSNAVLNQNLVDRDMED
jgi:transcriptional regulator with XRE-family HTH domain